MDLLKVYITSFLVVICLFVSSAYAESNVKIAVVDIEKALADSRPGANAHKGYDREVKSAQKEIDKKQRKYKKMLEEFKSQSKSLSQEALKKRSDDLGKLKKEIERGFEDLQEDLRKRNAEIVSKLLKELRKVVRKVAKDGNYTVVLQRGNPILLYADSSIDITEDIIKRFNDTMD